MGAAEKEAAGSAATGRWAAVEEDSVAVTGVESVVVTAAEKAVEKVEKVLEVAWEARKGEDLVEMAKGAVVKVEVAMEEV